VENFPRGGLLSHPPLTPPSHLGICGAGGQGPPMQRSADRRNGALQRSGSIFAVAAALSQQVPGPHTASPSAATCCRTPPPSLQLYKLCKQPSEPLWAPGHGHQDLEASPGADPGARRCLCDAAVQACWLECARVLRLLPLPS
jgi:hypothetical protein